MVIVEVSVEGRIPDRPLTGKIKQEADREVQVGDRVVMCADYCIICMATYSRVGDGSQAFLFHGIVCKSLAICVLAIPDSLWGAVLKADHVVFPIPDVVSEFATKYGISEIVGIEIHVKGVNVSRTVVINNYRAADGAFRLAFGVWHNTIQPFGAFSNIHV